MKKARKILWTIIVVGLFLCIFNFEYCEYLMTLTSNAAMECVTGGNEYSNKLRW